MAARVPGAHERGGGHDGGGVFSHHDKRVETNVGARKVPRRKFTQKTPSFGLCHERARLRDRLAFVSGVELANRQ